MKKTLLFTASMVALALPAAAQTYSYQQPTQQIAPQTQAEDPVMEHVRYLQDEWARIKYQVADKDAQLDAIHKLEEHADKVTTMYPGRPEPKIWEGIILSTDAGIVKDMSALGKVKKAKALLEASLGQDARAMNGSAYTSLGSLYYQVPGWPVAFGDDDEAEKNLLMALQINPEGIDPNFFYGDFLLQNERYEEARRYFEHALMAPDRPGRELADAGRRQEIKAKLVEIDQNGKYAGRSKYN